MTVFLLWGTFNGVEQLFTLYMQYVQKVSPLDTSLRFLPAPVSGVAANIIVGLLVHRVSAYVLVVIGIATTVLPPLLLAVNKPEWTYWALEFPAVTLLPAGADFLFTVSNLVVTDSFPDQTQGLAGGVFNTVSQIGKSVGLALCAIIANTVAGEGEGIVNNIPALLKGYRASFWFCLALNSAILVLSLVGLRNIGKVGKKRE